MPHISSYPTTSTLEDTDVVLVYRSGLLYRADVDLLATRSSGLIVAASDAPSWVKDGADYVCDGTDDHVEIQTALDRLPTIGGDLSLTFGTFNIASTVVVREDATTLRGAGVGNRTGGTQVGVGTKLKAASGLTGQVLKVQRTADDRPVYGVTLRDFLVDGNSIAGPVDGILFRSNRGLIDHVHVMYPTGNGIIVRGYAAPEWNCYDTHLSKIQVGNAGLSGVWFDFGGTDCHLLSGILYNSQWNLRMGGGSLQATGTHFYDATKNNIWFDSSGSRSKFSNCKIEGSGEHGVWLDSTNSGTSDVLFTGNNFKNSGDSADNTYDHFHISGPSGNGHTRTTIVGNQFSYQSSASPNKPRYGINLAGSSSQSSVITGNAFGPASHWGTAPINNNASPTAPPLIKNNGGIATENIVTKGSAAYTAAASDEAGYLRFTGTNPTFTLPPNSSVALSVGTKFEGTSTATAMTIVAGAGVTVNKARTLVTVGAFSGWTAIKVATDVWDVHGDFV